MVTSEFQWTHVFNFSQTFGGVTLDYAGTQGPSSAAGTPQDRINLIVGWNRGPLTVTGTVRYVSDYQSTYWLEAAADGAPPCISRLDGPDCHVASFTTLDLSAQYTGWRNWQILRVHHQRVQPPRAVQPRGRVRQRQLQLQLGIRRGDGHPVQPRRALHVQLKVTAVARAAARRRRAELTPDSTALPPPPAAFVANAHEDCLPWAKYFQRSPQVQRSDRVPVNSITENSMKMSMMQGLVLAAVTASASATALADTESRRFCSDSLVRGNYAIQLQGAQTTPDAPTQNVIGVGGTAIRR